MTGRIALSLVRGAAGWLSCRVPVADITPRRAYPIGDGTTRLRSGGLYVDVGVNEISAQPDHEFRDGEALFPLIALFHEAAGHVMQMTHEFNNTNTLSKVLFFSQCACKGSAQYYGIDDNGIPREMYFSHPHEIAAQYMGIKCGYEYLSCVYPDDAEHMMLDYIDCRRERGCAFLPEDAEFDTINGALKAINREFRRCVEAHRNFDPSYDSDDALGKLADCNKNKPVLDMVRNCRNGLRQDGMMACAFLAMMPYAMPDDNKFLKSTKVCADLDLNISKMFNGVGCPLWPPIRPLTNLERLRSVTDKIDREEIAKQHGHDFEKQ